MNENMMVAIVYVAGFLAICFCAVVASICFCFYHCRRRQGPQFCPRCGHRF